MERLQIAETRVFYRYATPSFHLLLPQQEYVEL